MILLLAVLVFQATYCDLAFNLVFFSTCIAVLHTLQCYFEFSNAKETIVNTCFVLLCNALLSYCMNIFYLKIGEYIVSIKNEIKQTKALLDKVEQGIIVLDTKSDSIIQANKKAESLLK